MGMIDGPEGVPMDAGTRPPVVALRPLGAADILDGAVRLVRRHARAAYTVSIPFAVVRAVLTAVLGLSTGALTQLGGLGGLAIAAGFGTVVTGLLTPVFAGDLLGEQLSARTALRRVGRRWWPLTVLALAAALAEHVALGALVVGGVWLWGVWAVVAPAMIVEGLGVRRAFGRSLELVRDVFWRTWGLRSLGWVLTYVLGVFISLPFLVLAGVLGDLNPIDTANSPSSSAVFVVISAIGTLLSTALIAPVTSAVEVLLYLDLRMRREGLDIVLNLPAPPAAPVGAVGVSAW